MPETFTPEIRIIIEDYISAEINPKFEMYEVRITDLDNTVTREKVLAFCKTQSSIFLGGEEYANNHHFHLAIAYENIPKKADFNKLVYDYFQVPLNKKGLPSGNASHSSKKVKNSPEYLCYCLKDGSYFSQGFSDEFMEFLFSHSFKKQSMITSLEEIFAEFQDSEITNVQMAERIIILRSTFNCFTISKVQEMVQSQEVIKNPLLAKDISQEKIKYLS